MANGMVEMQIQGEDNQIRIILSKIKEGDRFIRVDDIRKKEIALHPDEKRFEVRHF
jgi:acylphosphatase